MLYIGQHGRLKEVWPEFLHSLAADQELCTLLYCIFDMCFCFVYRSRMNERAMRYSLLETVADFEGVHFFS